MSEGAVAESEFEQKPRILCVDDEPMVLEGLLDTIGRRYDVTTADSGIKAISELRLNGPFEVVISDMRMPLMDGAKFLTSAKTIAPDTTRMVLSGYAEVDAAIAAVNSGSIFRFLVKPCKPDDLIPAIDAAARQYRLINSERVLLEQTLAGAVTALTQVLSFTSPVSFGATDRIRKRTLDLLTELGVEPDWQIELACNLCMIGNVSLGEELSEKLFSGARIDLKEKALVGNVHRVTDGLLAGIPRLETVRSYLAAALGSPRGLADQPVQARALRLVIAFDRFVQRGMEPTHALDALKNEKEHGEDVLTGIAKSLGAGVHGLIVVPVAIHGIEPGQLFAQDVKSTSGHLLVTHLQPATESMIQRLKKMSEMETIEYKTIQMLVQPNSAAARAASRYEKADAGPVGLPLAFGIDARMVLALQFDGSETPVEVERDARHEAQIVGDLAFTITDIARVTVTYPENVVEVVDAAPKLGPSGSKGFHTRAVKEVEKPKPTGPTADEAWGWILTKLKEELNEKTFARWFTHVRPLELTGGALVLAVPDDESLNWINDHYLALILAELHTVVTSDLTIRLEVREPEPEAEKVYTPTVTVEALIGITVSFGEGYELTALEQGEALRHTLTGDVDVDIIDVARLTVGVVVPEEPAGEDAVDADDADDAGDAATEAA
jgi:CheY-like chemotaxis protein